VERMREDEGCLTKIDLKDKKERKISKRVLGNIHHYLFFRKTIDQGT
jgi:hypothetical protein